MPLKEPPPYCPECQKPVDGFDPNSGSEPCMDCKHRQGTTEDPRKTALKRGLYQLSSDQINRVLHWPHSMVLDDVNYHDGSFCPLAIGVGLERMPNPSDAAVIRSLTLRGFSIFNTRGVKGEFYTTDRARDLEIAAREILEERHNKRLITVIGVGYNGRLLLLQRASGTKYEHDWCIPGGKIEPDESVCECAGRELAEETGITETPTFAREFDGGDFRYSMYMLKLDYRPNIQIETDKFQGYGWFKIPGVAFVQAMRPAEQAAMELVQ